MQPKHIILLVVGIIVVWALAQDPDEETTESSETASACASDYTACSDLQQALDENREIQDAATACQMTAEDRAKYGEPEWPWVPFGAAHIEKTNLGDGRIVLVEDDAQFQNGFGAMQNVAVLCHYDLIHDQVTLVDIRE